MFQSEPKPESLEKCNKVHKSRREGGTQASCSDISGMFLTFTLQTHFWCVLLFEKNIKKHQELAYKRGGCLAETMRVIDCKGVLLNIRVSSIRALCVRACGWECGSVHACVRECVRVSVGLLAYFFERKKVLKQSPNESFAFLSIHIIIASYSSASASLGSGERGISRSAQPGSFNVASMLLYVHRNHQAY